MKKLSALLVFIALTFFGETSHLYAMPQSQSKNFIIVELTIGKEKLSRKLKVPSLSNPKERKLIDDQFDVSGISFTETCPKDIGCECMIIATADALSEDKFKVTVTLNFKDRKDCDSMKEFLVVRGETREMKAGCRTRIKAYYDEPKAITKTSNR